MPRRCDPTLRNGLRAFTAMPRHVTKGTIGFCVIGLALSFTVGSAERHERTAAPETAPLHHGAPAMGAPLPAGPFVIDSAKSSGELLDQTMAVMSRDMKQAPMTGDPDHDFAAMMIPHHQGAIDMAKAFLLHGRDTALRRLAQEIIVTQQQEIKVMQLRLATMPTGGGSAPTEKKQDAAAPLPVSEKDRVYTCDQTSNTVSVISPASNTLLG